MNTHRYVLSCLSVPITIFADSWLLAQHGSSLQPSEVPSFTCSPNQWNRSKKSSDKKTERMLRGAGVDRMRICAWRGSVLQSKELRFWRFFVRIAVKSSLMRISSPEGRNEAHIFPQPMRRRQCRISFLAAPFTSDFLTLALSRIVQPGFCLEFATCRANKAVTCNEAQREELNMTRKIATAAVYVND